MNGSSTSSVVGEGASIATWPLGNEHLEIAARWLADERNARLLDFGVGIGTLTPAVLKLMSQRDRSCIWVFGPSDTRSPAGLVGFGNIRRHFGSAELWYLLGDKTHARKHLTTRAVSGLLNYGFREIGLHCVHAWTVESNRPSRRILERMGFRVAGRLRESHRLEGRRHDRLWFDLLADEYREYGTRDDPDAWDA